MTFNATKIEKIAKLTIDKLILKSTIIIDQMNLCDRYRVSFDFCIQYILLPWLLLPLLCFGLPIQSNSIEIFIGSPLLTLLPGFFASRGYRLVKFGLHPFVLRVSLKWQIEGSGV